jgi:hypothetical protein
MADDGGQFGAGGARASDAGVRDLCGGDAGRGTGLAHRLVQGLAGLGFADPNDVAGSGARGGEGLGVVGNGAGGFGSSPVDAEIVGHGLFLT